MIRKSIFAILGGVAFATVLSFAVSASAACGGLCQGVIGHYWFAGCDLVVVCDGPCYGPYGSCCQIVDAVCYYTEGPALVDPNIAE